MSHKGWDFFGEIIPDGYADVLAAIIDNEQLVDPIPDEFNIDHDRRHTERMRTLVIALTPTVMEMIDNETEPRDDTIKRLTEERKKLVGVIETAADETAPPVFSTLDAVVAAHETLQAGLAALTEGSGDGD